MRLKKFLTEQDLIPKDAKILNYPEFRQVFTYDCGANALQTVLVYYGQDVREKTIMKQLGTDPVHGTNVDDMIKGAKYYGIDAVAKTGMTVEDLKSNIDNGWPTIIALQAYPEKDPGTDWKKLWSEGHYVVSVAYDDEFIYFEDPSDTKRTFLSYEELDDRWHDQDDNGKKYQHWGMTCKGDPVFKHDAVTYLD